MKNLLLSIFLLITLSYNAMASAIAGADITYKAIGVNTYRVTLTYYHDCSDPCDYPQLRIFYTSTSCGVGSLTYKKGISTYNFPSFNVSMVERGMVPNPCSTLDNTSCLGKVGIEKEIFEGDIILPKRCADWTFFWMACCRIGANNIAYPTTEEVTVYSRLNNLNGDHDSPYFTHPGVLIESKNVPFCYTNGTVKPFGDSITYQFTSPLQYLYNPGIYPVSFYSMYNYLKPFYSSTPITLNSATGELCATPGLVSRFVFAELVSDYKNGVLIGQVERDMELIVQNDPCLPGRIGEMLNSITESIFPLVYPNPARDMVTIVTASPDTHVSVVDIIGQTVKQADSNNEEQFINLSVRDLPEGTYLLQLSDKKNSWTLKLEVDRSYAY